MLLINLKCYLDIRVVAPVKGRLWVQRLMLSQGIRINGWCWVCITRFKCVYNNMQIVKIMLWNKQPLTLTAPEG